MSDYFHFFDVLLNRSGAALAGYFARVIDPADQSVVTIYADASATPIIAASGVANMARSDTNGNVDFYVEPGTYHLDLYTSDAVTFSKRVLNVAMNSTKGDKGDKGDQGDVGNPGPALATFTALGAFKAAPITNKTQVLQDPSIKFGMFNWETANAPYTADDLDTIKADSTSLNVGAWKRANPRVLSAKDYNTPQAAANAGMTQRSDVYLPAGDIIGDVDTTSDAIFEGPGRLFDTSNVQRSTYAEPRSRFVVGQEYLWAFHAAVANQPTGSVMDIVFSGDSTTYGSFDGGVLPGQFRLNNLSDTYLGRYGIHGPRSFNRGTPGITTREWIGPPLGITPSYTLDQTKTEFPDMVLWALRFGLNDGSTTSNGYHNIANYRADIRQALTTIRAWKGVDELSIVLMSPNSTSETGLRDEAWLEQVSRVLKRAARDFKCTFIDTYALLRDARAGVNLWLDDDGAGGSGIHPDGVNNLWIMKHFAEVVYAPLIAAPQSTNNFINVHSNVTRAISASVPVSSFLPGISIFRTDSPNTFPINGIIRVTKSADGIATQENIGFSNSSEGAGLRTYTRYGIDGTTWSSWRGLDANPALQNAWTNFSTIYDYPSYRKTAEGTVLVQGKVKNAGTVTAGSLIATLPAGYRPPANQRFMVWNAAGTTFGTIELQTDGSLVYVSGDKNDLGFNFAFQAVD